MRCVLLLFATKHDTEHVWWAILARWEAIVSFTFDIWKLALLRAILRYRPFLICPLFCSTAIIPPTHPFLSYFRPFISCSCEVCLINHGGILYFLWQKRCPPKVWVGWNPWSGLHVIFCHGKTLSDWHWKCELNVFSYSAIDINSSSVMHILPASQQICWTNTLQYSSWWALEHMDNIHSVILYPRAGEALFGRKILPQLL